MKPLLFLIILTVACGGSSPSPQPQCRPFNDTCISTLDCCDRLVCQNSLCITPPADRTSPPDLAMPPDMATKPPTCSAAGQSCTAAHNTCCPDVTCPRYGTRCQSGSIGDACASNGDCLAGLFCSGWCTKACASRADCSTPAGVNECVLTNGDGYLCFPFCQTNADCAVYGPRFNCSPGNIAEGGTITVCG